MEYIIGITAILLAGFVAFMLVANFVSAIVEPVYADFPKAGLRLFLSGA